MAYRFRAGALLDIVSQSPLDGLGIHYAGAYHAQQHRRTNEERTLANKTAHEVKYPAGSSQ